MIEHHVLISTYETGVLERALDFYLTHCIEINATRARDAIEALQKVFKIDDFAGR